MARLVDESGTTVFQGDIENGGSQTGNVRIVSFPFAFDTPGIVSGVTVLTPAADDLLLDAWIEYAASWDTDAQPLADIGVVHAGAFDPFGLFAGALGNAYILNSPWNVGTDSVYASSQATPWTLAAASATAFGQVVPWRWTTTGPLTLLVNDTGTPAGADPVMASGSGILRMVVCTP